MINQPRWKAVEYSRSQIIRAGKIVKKANATGQEKEEAIKIIDNWRAAHAFPLHVIYIHLRNMAKMQDDIIVAERLKRLDSILNKLNREPTMSLWTMQDLGGCRFIVPEVADIYKYADNYERSRKRHILTNEYDYVKNPKPSGYRSLHRVYEYHSDKNDTYNRNMLIELQFRTHLQHVWATAVETMGLFTKEAIKSGQGSDDVKRFFALVSSLFAIREGQPIVPGTVNDVDELVHEIEAINERNNYLDFLSGIKVAVEAQKKQQFKGNPAYFILLLNYNTHRLSVIPFQSSDFDNANAAYNAIEATRRSSQNDAVLVRVSSFGALKKAYPNYFTDISEFVSIVKGYLK